MVLETNDPAWDGRKEGRDEYSSPPMIRVPQHADPDDTSPRRLSAKATLQHAIARY